MDSEALRAQKREQQIAAERERDDEAEAGFEHDLPPLQPPNDQRVEAKQCKCANAEAEIGKVQHDIAPERSDHIRS